MKRTSCAAVVSAGRINLVIRKGSKGYKAFANVLDTIEKDGYWSWYGDIVDATGKEQSGLVITSQPTKQTREP